MPPSGEAAAVAPAPRVRGVSYTAAPSEPATTPRCLNCEAPLEGPYCAHCGQRHAPPRPTTRELLGEAWDEFVNVDGRAARTLRLLVTRPGALTAEQLAGRRARYVRPLRLYLLCSAAYFLADSVLPMPAAARAEHARLAEVAAAEHGDRGAATPACEPRRARASRPTSGRTRAASPPRRTPPPPRRGAGSPTP